MLRMRKSKTWKDAARIFISRQNAAPAAERKTDMGIFYEESGRVFTLQTRHSTYQMKADEQGVLLHTYYGEKTDNSDLSCLITRGDRGFSGNPFSMGCKDRT